MCGNRVACVNLRVPVSEFAPSHWRVFRQAERLARGGIRALRARQEDESGEWEAGGKMILSER